MSVAEFDFIARYLRPLAGEGGLSLTDDAALVNYRPGMQLVISADTMVAGTHFFPNDPPDLLARKLLRCNLSDMAAMGAQPAAYLLALSCPQSCRNEDWFAAFTQGLRADQEEFSIALIGGDTTSTAGPLTLSVTILGHVRQGQAIMRSRARAGDTVWVTGTVGDAALGLLAIQGKLSDESGYLAGRYRLPQPRLGLELFSHVHAMMDISDGLIQDARHLATESRVKIILQADLVPRSAAARKAGEDYLPTCLTGGDDYELLFTVPPGHEAAVKEEAARNGVCVTCIGQCMAGEPDVVVYDARGQIMTFAQEGWKHF